MHFRAIKNIIYVGKFLSKGVRVKMSDVLTLIESKMNCMSKRQKSIAEYILGNYDKASFMTAAKLSKETGVSESTVVRFAAELGFDGYQKLQRALKEVTRAKLNALQRIDMASDRIDSNNILDTVLQLDIEKIHSTMEEIDPDQFEKAADALVKARRIYILGLRSSATLARFLFFYINPVFDDVKLINASSGSEMFEQILKVNEQDVVFGISFPRYSTRTVQALEYAKSKGATVIGLTDTGASPIKKVADYCLTACSDMVSFVDTLVAPLSVLNALLVSIGMKKRDDVYRSYGQLEEIWDKYGVYNVNDLTDDNNG